LCELIFIELYMQLRNPAFFVTPYTTQESSEYCPLQHHGVTHFATANVKHFRDFGFEQVWNPMLE